MRILVVVMIIIGGGGGSSRRRRRSDIHIGTVVDIIRFPELLELGYRNLFQTLGNSCGRASSQVSVKPTEGSAKRCYRSIIAIWEVSQNQGP